MSRYVPEAQLDKIIEKATKLASERTIMAFLSEADAPKPEAKPKAKAKAKAKVKRVVKRTQIKLPEGWENAEIEVEVPDEAEDAEKGATITELRSGRDHRRISYNEARAEGLDYKASNEAGLHAVVQALA